MINSIMDRFNPTSTNILKMARLLLDFMGGTGVLAPGVNLFPQSKAFFFSSGHHSYSRIDYFVIEQSLLPFVMKAKYSTITESDPAHVLLDIAFPLFQTGCPLGNWIKAYYLIKHFVG